jgi:uncharacterized membrane protein
MKSSNIQTTKSKLRKRNKHHWIDAELLIDVTITFIQTLYMSRILKGSQNIVAVCTLLMLQYVKVNRHPMPCKREKLVEINRIIRYLVSLVFLDNV